MSKLSDRVTWLEENSANADAAEDAISKVDEIAVKTAGRVDRLVNFVRGGDLGPGLAGEVRELTQKVDLILSNLGLHFVPDHQVHVPADLTRTPPAQPEEDEGE